MGYSIISALFAAIANYTDKYLIEKRLHKANVGSLVIFSALIGVPTLIIIGLLFPQVLLIDPINATIIIFGGMLYILWVILYLYALKEAETSTVAPLFQLSAAFSYLLAFIFLKETLTFTQFTGCVFILIGSVALSLKKINRTYGINKRVFILMTLASLLAAANSLIFKVIAIEETFWTTEFWEFVGFSIMGFLILAFVKPYRTQFLKVLRTNSTGIISLNIFNEAINLVSKIAFNFGTLLAPIALVTFVTEGFQPFIVLALGIILTKLLPKLIKENIKKQYLMRKIFAILIIFIGTLILHIGE